MPKIIIDSSVCIKWYSSENEKLLDKALHVYKSVKKGLMDASAPKFLIVELLNVLITKKKINQKDIQFVLKDILDLGIKFFPFELEQSYSLSKLMFKYDATSYDSLYLLLAKQKKCKLLTVDEELLKIKNLTISLNQVWF